MKFIIVMECDDPTAADAIGRLLQEAPRDFNGLGQAFIQMSWNEPTGKRPGSSIKAWWWGNER